MTDPSPTPQELDGGLTSRKLWLAVLTQVFLVLVALLTTAIPSLAPLYSTIAGSLVGVLAIYCGGNVATRWVHKDETGGEGKAGSAP